VKDPGPFQPAFPPAAVFCSGVWRSWSDSNPLSISPLSFAL